MKIDLNKYKAFFFDFDGVIVDSLDVKTEAFGELFSMYGKDISEKVIEYHRNNGGVSRYEKFKYFYKNLLNKKIDQKIIRKLDKDYSRLAVEKVITVPYIKGAMAFLKKLNRVNTDCFIVSGTPQKEIRYILKRRRIRRFFREAVGSPSDKTENVKGILKEYKIDPKKAVFFGDAKSDYNAARDNGVDFVGIVNDKSKELKGLPCTCKAKDFSRVKVLHN